jgi:DNA-binding response OmpR family regulator
MEDKKLVLVVEDGVDERTFLRMTLESRGYGVVEADAGQVGVDLYVRHKPDLVVLDINLPDFDGVEVCRKIRASQVNPATPVIMLTGKSDMNTKAAGFTAGADQYLVKPVSGSELVLWVDALFRREGFYQKEGEVLRCGDLTIDVASRVVEYKGKAVDRLTAREFDLLYSLVKTRPAVISRDGILKDIWKTVADDNLVDVHLNNLRKKLPEDVARKIQSIRGKGYRYFE